MNAPEPTKSRAGRDLLLVFALLAAGVVTGGYFYHRSYERHYRDEVERQLSAIADMKVAQIIQWRRERLADANLIRATPYYARRALDALAQLDSARTRQMFTGGLGPLLANGRYDRVLLLDEQLDVRLVHPEDGSRALAGAVRGPAEQALRTRQVVLTDLHRAADGVAVHLELLVPLVVRREGANDNVPAAGLDPSPADRSTGVLVLQINAQEYLFPLLQAWPTSSRTAETLLVRREGNDVVFLNDLRFQTNTALNLRMPLDRVGLPATQAALGREVTMTGVDYRGVGVVAVTRVIPHSPWALVARMDTAEAYAPIRERVLQMIVLIGALLLGVGASVGLIARQQRLRFYRAQAESAEALRQTRDYLENLLDHANAPIIVWDPQFKIVRFNHAFETLTGRRADEVIGKSLELLFPPPFVDGSMALFKQTTGGEPWEGLEIPILHLDGWVRTVLWNSATITAPDGKTPMATIAQGQDITKRKEAEEALRRSEAELRTLAEAMPQIVWITRPDGWNIYFNQQWMDYTGLTLEESLGHGWNKPFHPDDQRRAWDAWQHATATIGIYSLECRLRRADGTYRWWLTRGVPERDAAGQVRKWYGTCTDIHERKQAEEKIKSALADLERSNQELEQFAYVASHDLQEPLRMVASYTQLLAHRYQGQLDDKARKYIAYAVDGAIRMQTLINDLLAYSRVGSRGQALQPTDAHAVLGEALRNLAAMIEEHPAIITNDDLPTVHADASQLVLVFQNLLANAIKFQGPDLPRIHVSVQDRGHEWVFAVQDNGIGIEPQHAERIFVIFQRLHTREQYPGTGIGLAVCKRIVERHGGRIWFESAVGNGSTFFFAVPKCAPTSPPKPHPPL